MIVLPLSFSHTAVFHAPAEKVWQALTDPAHLDRWDSTSSIVDLRVGGGFVQNFAYGPTRAGTYLAVEPNRRLVQQNRVFGLNRSYLFNNAVSLEEIPEGTRLHVIVDGFEDDEDQQFLRESMDMGWELNLHVLRAYVENGEDARERVWRGILMGLRYITINQARYAETGISRGVYLLTVAPGKPAAVAGLQAGDVIVAVDGTPVMDFRSLRRLLVHFSPGDRMPVRFVRGGETQDTTVILGSAV